MTEQTVISVGQFTRIGPGYRLNDIYEVDSLLASGGMGEIYCGHAIETGHKVAIKTIRPEFAQNTAALALFRKEASALRDLNHEAIIRYFVFSIDKGLPYLAMEFVEGKSLSDLLNRGPLSFEQLCILQKRLAGGLQAAHDLGIIHRDVSPDNIILPDDNVARAKIIDFGIARSTQGEGTVIGNAFAGKFGYVSPEQFGLFGGEVTGKSDIYSLGLVLAEAALGRAIDMGGNHVEVIEKRRSVPDLSAIDPRLRPLLTSMLQPDPKDRLGSMAELVAWAPCSSPGVSRSSRRVGVAAAIALVLAGFGAAAYQFGPLLRGLVPGLGMAPGQLEAVSPPRSSAKLPEAPLGGDATQPSRDNEPHIDPPPPMPQPAPAPRPEPASSSPVREPAPPQPTGNILPPSAVVPEKTASPPSPPVSVRRPTAEQVRSYLREYNGGACFLVMPVQVGPTDAKIEAYGTNPAPFVTFDAAFQRSMGFEPEISLRQVTSQQCPVVDFLARVPPRNSRPPRLTLRSDRLRSGEELAGTVESGADPTVEILLVADDGLVHNLRSYAKRTGGGASFNLRVEGSAGGDKPQLVIAVASARPIPSLATSGTITADKLFKQLSEEARNQVDVAVKYFKLGG